MQYRDGTVNVTNGSTTVELVGGAAIGNVLAGNMFIVSDPSLMGAGVPYFVASNAVADDEFTLTAPWAGDTATGRVYAVHRDFIGDIPLMNPDDIELPAIFNRAMAVLAAGGGGGVLTFQDLIDTPSYSGAGGQVPAVNEDENALEYLDHRFLRDVLSELSPTALSGRLVHYSMLSGTFSVSDDRVAQWNDISGNSRHAAADSIGPIQVGESGRPSYGMHFYSTDLASDDVKMLATVPSTTAGMFFFIVGRVDPAHGVSRNVFKTAHNGSVDTQTSGDIEFGASGSGNNLRFLISTSGGTGQTVTIGPLKTGLPYVMAVAIVSGNVTGFFAQAGMAITPIELSYTHGSGFDADRLRLGTAVDAVTDQTLHELVITSTIPSVTDMRRVTVWGTNRYLAAYRLAAEPAPRLTSPLRAFGQRIMGALRGVIDTDGTDIAEYILPYQPLAVLGTVTAKADWSGGVLRHSGDGTCEVILPPTLPIGWTLAIEQDADASGNMTITVGDGGSNVNTFPLGLSTGERLDVEVVRNADAGSAGYVGFKKSAEGSVGSGGGGGIDVVNTDLTALTVSDDDDGKYYMFAPASPATVTLGNVTAEDKTVGLAIGNDETLTVDVASGVQYYLPEDNKATAGRTASFQVLGSVTITCIRVDAGDRRYLVEGQTDHPQEIRYPLTLSGGIYTKAVTRGAGSSQPTVADSGAWITTDGDLTIPNIANWQATIELGGDDDMSFDGGTWDVGGAAGDVFTAYVKASGVIRITPLIEAADLITEADF